MARASTSGAIMKKIVIAGGSGFLGRALTAHLRNRGYGITIFTRVPKAADPAIREVDWDARQIRKAGKGGNSVVTPIDATIRGILWPLRGHHQEFVFTYVARRTLKNRGLVRGQRYPLSYNGVKTAWRRLLAEAGVEGFRFHDYRHNLGTKILRETGNLKLVQRVLNHADLKTTARYAHLADDPLQEATNRVDALISSLADAQTAEVTSLAKRR